MNEYPQLLQDPQTVASTRTGSSVFIPWVIHPRIGESGALYWILCSLAFFVSFIPTIYFIPSSISFLLALMDW